MSSSENERRRYRSSDNRSDNRTSSITMSSSRSSSHGQKRSTDISSYNRSRSRSRSSANSDNGRTKSKNERENEHERTFRFKTRKCSETAKLARTIALKCLREGDTVLLHGAVGSGKSVFARELVRALIGDAFMAVTSPTYLIQNTYDTTSDNNEGTLLKHVHHFDLYRLPDENSLRKLIDLEKTFAKDSVAIFEWPDRLGSLKPEQNRVDVYLTNFSENNDDDDSSKDVFIEVGETDDVHLLMLDENDDDLDDTNDDDDDDDDEEDYMTTTPKTPSSSTTMRTIEIKPFGDDVTKRMTMILEKLEINRNK